MSDARSFAVFISSLKVYPHKLAAKLGLERCVLFYEYFIKFGDCKFEFIESIGTMVGILNSKDIFDSLVTLGYIKKHEETTYEINFDKIIEVSGGSLSLDLTVPFNDREFLSLIVKYKSLLQSRGRIITNKNLFAKFDGKTLKQSVKALKLSVDNKYITLYFNDKYTGNNSTDSDRDKSRGRSGGETNEGRGGEFDTIEI